MRRYLRLYAYFVRFSISRAMEFRFDFFFRIVMDCVYYAVNLIFFGVIYTHVSDIAGWSEPQAMIFVAGYLFVDAVNMTLFSNNNWWFPIFVNRGDLDYYLVRPVSSFFFLSLREFAANSCLNLVMTLGILYWAIQRYPGELGAINIAVFMALLLVGVGLNHIIMMMFMVPVFWAHKVDGLRMLGYSTTELGERPHGIYGPIVKRVLLSVFPAAVISSLPAYTLFEGLTALRFLHFAAVVIVAALVLRFFWKRGLRAYSSASS